MSAKWVSEWVGRSGLDKWTVGAIISIQYNPFFGEQIFAFRLTARTIARKGPGIFEGDMDSTARRGHLILNFHDNGACSGVLCSGVLGSSWNMPSLQHWVKGAGLNPSGHYLPIASFCFYEMFCPGDVVSLRSLLCCARLRPGMAQKVAIRQIISQKNKDPSQWSWIWSFPPKFGELDDKDRGKELSSFGQPRQF